MNPKYIGDSYDIVKQSLLRWLADIGTWTTHPMFTEPVSAWQADAFSLLLGTRLLSSDTLTHSTNRDSYLAPARFKRILIPGMKCDSICSNGGYKYAYYS